MKKIASGKTKDVFEKENGNLVLFFKDDVTGDETGVNPGANQVTGQIKGKGRMSFELTCYFFNLLKEKGIRTHLVEADMSEAAMEVKKAQVFGASGLEFIWRSVACGSFYRRYQTLIEKEFQPLKEPVVEITLKDDEGGDPLINSSSLVGLGLFTKEQVQELIEMTKKAIGYIDEDLAKKGLKLLDIKIEFGDIGGFGIIDEISGDSMRVSSDKGVLSHEELYQSILGNGHNIKN